MRELEGEAGYKSLSPERRARLPPAPPPAPRKDGLEEGGPRVGRHSARQEGRGEVSKDVGESGCPAALLRNRTKFKPREPWLQGAPSARSPALPRPKASRPCFSTASGARSACLCPHPDQILGEGGHPYGQGAATQAQDVAAKTGRGRRCPGLACRPETGRGLAARRWAGLRQSWLSVDFQFLENAFPNGRNHRDTGGAWAPLQVGEVRAWPSGREGLPRRLSRGLPLQSEA